MIELLFASALHAALLQSTAANGARNQFRACIKEAAAEAKNQKLAADAFPDFARGRCTAQEAAFKAALWAFDAKNKVSRKQSESDAELQLEDLIISTQSNYEMDSAPQ